MTVHSTALPRPTFQPPDPVRPFPAVSLIFTLTELHLGLACSRWYSAARGRGAEERWMLFNRMGIWKGETRIKSCRVVQANRTDTPPPYPQYNQRWVEQHGASRADGCVHAWKSTDTQRSLQLILVLPPFTRQPPGLAPANTGTDGPPTTGAARYGAACTATCRRASVRRSLSRTCVRGEGGRAE